MIKSKCKNGKTERFSITGKGSDVEQEVLTIVANYIQNVAIYSEQPLEKVKEDFCKKISDIVLEMRMNIQ